MMKKKAVTAMRFRTFFYSLKQGLINIKRNKLYSLASIGTITACIFLIGLFYAVVVNLQYMVKNVEKQVGVQIFFDEGIDTSRINEIGAIIDKRVEVDNVKYTSPEEAWESFKEIYFQDKEYLAEGFKNDNPLANSGSFTVYLNDLSMQSAFVSYMEGIEGVRQINVSKNTANVITDFGKLVGLVSGAIIIILLAVGIFLISNTVMIGIAVRKEEIGIMKLMGATDYFVRAPFLVEGLCIGLVGAAIPLAILYFIYNEVVEYILTQFSDMSLIVNFINTNEVFKILVPLALIIGAGIGLLGSMITIRKYLKV